MSLPASFRLLSLARRLALWGAVGAGFVALPSHAVTYTELGDAEQTQSTAQTTGPAGTLTDIFGTLSSSFDADLYVINITNLSTFSASTFNAGTNNSLDTQIFLLTMSGAPVEFNDDDAGGMSTLSTLPAGGTFAPKTTGSYILGISVSGYNPVNSNNQSLFAMGLTTSVQGPASGLQPAVLGGFFDSTYDSEMGAYDLKLTGAATSGMTPAVPEPATNAMLLLGGAFGAFALSRRRRGAARSSAV